MANTVPRRMTLAEFLEWDDGTDTRYELIGGAPVAMAPALQGHDRLVARFVTLLNNRLRPPCIAIPNTGLLSTVESSTFFVPDVVMTCAPARPGSRFAEEPRLVAEVLSPSTRGVDMVVKLSAYRDMPSMADIVHIWTTARRVDLYQRDAGGWHLRTFIGDAVLPLSNVTSPVPMLDLYDGVPLESWDFGLRVPD